jgi:chemotaxis family two-component system sensor kinase Cph1
METLLSQEALQQAFDNMAEAVWIYDDDRTLVYQNSIAAQMSHAMIGESWEEANTALERRNADGDLLTPESAPVIRALRGEIVRNQEVHVLIKDSGEQFVWIYNAVPVRNKRGEIRRVVLNVRDITDERRRDEALAALNRDLERSNRDLEHFASMVAHDLREPLRIIGSYSQLLARRNAATLDEISRHHLQHILTNVDRMDALIHSLMELSRLDTEGARGLVRVDANLCLGISIHNLQFKVDEAEATVTTDPLPVVLANETLLVHLFQNLLSNAIKYSDRRPRVHVSVEKGGNHWQFSVRDNGIGIASRDHERIFEMFQRLHAREQYSGTGIGLSLCKRIVGRFGGRIWVESQPHQGSTFFFTLPFCEQDDQSD